MSPSKICFSSAGITKTGIFERLRADIELRFRAMRNYRSELNIIMDRIDTHIEEILIRREKEMEIKVDCMEKSGIEED